MIMIMGLVQRLAKSDLVAFMRGELFYDVQQQVELSAERREFLGTDLAAYFRNCITGRHEILRKTIRSFRLYFLVSIVCLTTLFIIPSSWSEFTLFLYGIPVCCVGLTLLNMHRTIRVIERRYEDQLSLRLCHALLEFESENPDPQQVASYLSRAAEGFVRNGFVNAPTREMTKNAQVVGTRIAQRLKQLAFEVMLAPIDTSMQYEEKIRTMLVHIQARRWVELAELDEPLSFIEQPDGWRDKITHVLISITPLLTVLALRSVLQELRSPWILGATLLWMFGSLLMVVDPYAKGRLEVIKELVGLVTPFKKN